jgi:hypothetical protein
MADADALSLKIDVRLRSLAGRLAALPLYARVESGRASLDAEWRDTLDRMDWAHEQYAQGKLTRAQAGAHERNLIALAESLTAIHELGLLAPRGAVAAWIAARNGTDRLAEPA